MSETTLRAAFAAAVLACTGCAADTRYHEGLLASLGAADRRQCEQVAQVARERAGTRSLSDLTADDWGFIGGYAFFGPMLIVTFEMNRANEADRTRAAEAALLACIESITEKEKTCASTSCGR